MSISKGQWKKISGNLSPLRYLQFHFINFLFFLVWFNKILCHNFTFISLFLFSIFVLHFLFYYFLNYDSILSVIFLLHLITVGMESLVSSSQRSTPLSISLIFVNLSSHCHGVIILILELFFLYFFSFMYACKCAGTQAGGYVCNYFTFIAFELIGRSLSESSWFSVLFLFIFPILSIMRLYFVSCVSVWDSSVGCEDWKSGRIKKAKQTQTNPTRYNSTLEKFCLIYHCNFAHFHAAFLSRQLYQVTYLVVG